MGLSVISRGDSLVRLLQGALVGLIATTVMGFHWGGWTLESTARQSAEQAANSAVVQALTSICVDKFQRAADANTTLTKLKSINAWKQDTFIENGGWATFPGAEAPNRNVADLCAKALNRLNWPRSDESQHMLPIQKPPA